MHMLPPITQLLPDIGIVYEDDSEVPGLMLTPTVALSGWRWLVCCGAILLLECEQGRVWRAHDLGTLVAFFLEKTGRSIAAEEADAEDKAETAVASTPLITQNSHVVMLA